MRVIHVTTHIGLLDAIAYDAIYVDEGQDFLDRLWVKDASLWKGEPAAIRNRLGWLTSPTIMRSPGYSASCVYSTCRVS